MQAKKLLPWCIFLTIYPCIITQLILIIETNADCYNTVLLPNCVAVASTIYNLHDIITTVFFGAAYVVRLWK